MIDLEQLEADRGKAAIDKADLFDFYHDNWNAVITELRQHQKLTIEAFDASSFGVRTDPRS